MEKEKIIWTIGHSTRSWEEFFNLLQNFNISGLIDVRSFPGSRKFPHFNKEILEQRLPAVGIQYWHMVSLGGRRKVVPDSPNSAWRNASFRGYADHMSTDEFKYGVRKLEQIAGQYQVAYMCSEAVWWRCHRALISDFMKNEGWRVVHIMDLNKSQDHPYTSAVRPVQGQLFYN